MSTGDPAVQTFLLPSTGVTNRAHGPSVWAGAAAAG